MKRLVLLFAGLLIGLTTATATEINRQKTKNSLYKIKKNHYAQPITFIERGIEFLIFPDGRFDFNTYTNDEYQNNSYYKSRFRRNCLNSNYRGQSPNTSYMSRLFSDRDVSITRDRYGKVRRINNTYLNYDRYGKITRVGNININYNRGHQGFLNQVGGLQVDYNRRGEIINIHGHVNYQDNYYYKNKRKRKNLDDVYDRHNDRRNHTNKQYYYGKQKVK